LTFTLAPHVDVQAWLYTRAFVKGGTTWDEGVLLRAVRDGYTTRTGRRVPYLILLSDFDRATRGQAEILRLIMDSTQGRVLGPRGETYVVFPGTQIVATANSTGGGDSTGRCISANPIDASLMDRFERKFLFHPLDREDEKEILSARYPNLANAIPGALDQILSATEKIREAVAAEQIYFEWSHRAVCAWVEAAEDLLFAFGPTATAPNLLQRAVRAVLDGSPNQETRDALKTLIDPHIRGGVIVTGSLDHHRKGPLV
jgi:MoxR-like ATPase